MDPSSEPAAHQCSTGALWRKSWQGVHQLKRHYPSVRILIKFPAECLLWSLSLCSVQCSLWSLSLCSLPSLCSGNKRPRSSYSLMSKRCSSQSLLPFQHSAVPTILLWMSTAIKPQPSSHPRCCTLSPKSLQKFCSDSIIFTGTSADLSTYMYI